MYMDARQSSKQERRFIERLTDIAGDKPISTIRQGDMTPVIRAFYPEAAAATINRQVFAPYAAITHWAARQDLCPYKPVEKMRETESRRRPAPEKLGPLLLKNTDGHQHAFCALLYHQGWRTSEALAQVPGDVNLRDGYFRVMVPKTGRIKSVPMHDAVRVAYANIPLDGETVFPWRDRFAVRRWWKPLVERLGYPTVTPHQFRHSFAMAGRDMKLTDDDLMEIGSWFNRKSVSAYTGTPSEHARSNLGRMRGRRGK